MSFWTGFSYSYMFSSDVDVVIVKQVGKIDLVMVKLVEINCLATSSI
jgi:hypothetical protein